MLNEYKVIIKIYYDILKYHNNYQCNWVKNIIEKNIIEK